MKVTKAFKLKLSQAALDFVDVDSKKDSRLFIDPHALSAQANAFSVECCALINTYFQRLINAIQDGEDAEAFRLLDNLHEPNETCFGYSRGRPRGRGIGGLQAKALFAALKSSTAVKTGFIEDLADTELLIPGIGPDKVSDITTNVIRKMLLEYTEEQCRLHSLPTEMVPMAVWDRYSWQVINAPMPVVQKRPILLVPKYLVRWKMSLSHQHYYSGYVLDYFRTVELAKSYSPLVHVIKKTGQRHVYKYLLEEEHPKSKEFLYDFSRQHKDVLIRYKREHAVGKPISNDDLDGKITEADLAKFLIAAIKGTPPGREDATDYHHLIAAACTLIFYPNLIYPKLEYPVEDRTKRVDIIYTNTAESGLFKSFTPTYQKTSGKVVIECKNYKDDISNPEIDQLTGRFHLNRGWLGFIACRTVSNRSRLVKRCRETALAGRGWVIPLLDKDFFKLLTYVIEGRKRKIENFVRDRFDELNA